MRRNAAILGIVVVIIVIATVLFQSRSTALPTVTAIPTKPATLALRDISTIPGPCDTFSSDWSLVTGITKVYETATGIQRFEFKLTGISFSPNMAYVGAEDAGIYDASTRELLFKVGRLTGVATSPIFSPDSTKVAVPGDGLYDIATRKKLITFTDKQFTMLFSPDSRLLAIVGYGVYDTSTGEQRYAIGGTVAPWRDDYASFSADGKYLAVEDAGLYKVATGEKVVGGFKVVFNADQTLVASAEGEVMDLSTGEKIVDQHRFVNLNPKFSPDSRYVALEVVPPKGNEKDIVWGIYDLKTRQKSYQFNGYEPTFSPDGKLLAMYGIGMFDLSDGKQLYTLPEGKLQFSPDGAVLAISGIGVFDTRDGKLRFGISKFQGFSPNGDLIADNGGVYEVATGARLAETHHVIFQPKGSRFAFATVDNKTCRIVNVVPKGASTPAS